MTHPYDYFGGSLDFLGLSGGFHNDYGHGGDKAGKLKIQQFISQKLADFAAAATTLLFSITIGIERVLSFIIKFVAIT